MLTTIREHTFKKFPFSILPFTFFCRIRERKESAGDKVQRIYINSKLVWYYDEKEEKQELYLMVTVSIFENLSSML